MWGNVDENPIALSSNQFAIMNNPDLGSDQRISSLYTTLLANQQEKLERQEANQVIQLDYAALPEVERGIKRVQTYPINQCKLEVNIAYCNAVLTVLEKARDIIQQTEKLLAMYLKIDHSDRNDVWFSKMVNSMRTDENKLLKKMIVTKFAREMQIKYGSALLDQANIDVSRYIKNIESFIIKKYEKLYALSIKVENSLRSEFSKKEPIISAKMQCYAKEKQKKLTRSSAIIDEDIEKKIDSRTSFYNSLKLIKRVYQEDKLKVEKSTKQLAQLRVGIEETTKSIHHLHFLIEEQAMTNVVDPQLVGFINKVSNQPCSR